MQCKFCDKTYDNHRALNGHQNAHLKSKKKDRSDKGILRVGAYETTLCLNCNDEVTYKHYNHSKARKYCSHKCQQEHQFKLKISLIEDGKINPSNSALVDKYLTERDGRCCSECKNVEWRGKPIPLDIDHIDGNPSNHKAINLRYLCPNCHRQSGLWGNNAARRSLGQLGRRRLDKARLNKFDSCKDHQE